MEDDTFMLWVGGIFAVIVIVIAALIWIPAINDCNEVHGELVSNAFGWPVCVNGDDR